MEKITEVKNDSDEKALKTESTEKICDGDEKEINLKVKTQCDEEVKDETKAITERKDVDMNEENNEKNNGKTKEEEKLTELKEEKSDCSQNGKHEPGTKDGEIDKEKASEFSKEIVQKVAERLRFFFSDVNLRSDRFMDLTMQRNHNMIPMETMGRFKTIQQYSSDPLVIEEAVKVHCADFLLVNEHGIGRKEPYDFKKGRGLDVPLSLFVDNLPVSNSGMFYDCTVPEVIDAFREYGKVALVRLRYMKDYKRREQKNACGNALIEFANQDDFKVAKEALVDGNPPNRTIVLKGKDLKALTMEDWLKNGRKCVDRSKVEINNTEEKDAAKDDEESEDEELVDKENDVTSFEKGGVISLQGIAKGCSREDILSAIQDYSDIWKVSDANVEEITKQKSLLPLASRNVYIDYSREQTHGAIRFTNSCIIEHREKIAELAEKLKLGEIKIFNDEALENAFVLEGEEEVKYWEKVMEFKKRKTFHQKRKKNFKNSKRSNKRRRRS